MSNILQAKVSIRGTRPLIQHKFGPDALPLEKQERTGVAGNSPDEWRKTCMITRDGQLYILPTYVFSCAREGAKNTKKGRGSIMLLVAATLQVQDDFILLDRYFPNFPNGHSFDVDTVSAPPNDLTAPVYLDICGVRNPATKARNVRYRVAAGTGWKTSFTLLFDKTIVDRKQMEAVMIDAGHLVGLGDGRSVGYGRFEVESFQVQD
jgi:hypothetical protein